MALHIQQHSCHITNKEILNRMAATLQHSSGVPRPGQGNARHTGDVQPAAAAAAATRESDSGSVQRSGRGRRLYDLVVSVMAGPPDSAFRFTKASGVSPSYVCCTRKADLQMTCLQGL